VARVTTLRADTPLPQQLTTLDSERMRAYRGNLEFYEGRQWTESQRRRDRRLTFNYARTIIEKTASYTMSGLTSVVDPADGTPEAAADARRAEQALRDVYDANALDQLDFDNEIDCSVLGDAVYKVTWDAVEERVRVSAPDVQGLYAWWLADDPARVWRYTLAADESEVLFDIPASTAAERKVIEVWTNDTFEL